MTARKHTKKDIPFRLPCFNCGRFIFERRATRKFCGQTCRKQANRHKHIITNSQ